MVIGYNFAVENYLISCSNSQIGVATIHSRDIQLSQRARCPNVHDIPLLIGSQYISLIYLKNIFISKIIYDII